MLPALRSSVLPGPSLIAFAQNQVYGFSLIQDHHPVAIPQEPNFLAVCADSGFSNRPALRVAKLIVWPSLAQRADEAKSTLELIDSEPRDKSNGPSIVGHSANCVIEVHVLVQTVLP
jgi:hypothetical protein